MDQPTGAPNISGRSVHAGVNGTASVRVAPARVRRSIPGVNRDFVVAGPALPRAQAWLDAAAAAGSEPAVRAAATVMVLRPGLASFEVFMLRRNASMAFAAGMHVFPGGGVDDRDADPGLTWFGPPPQALATALGTDPAQARALLAAAVRETFEECGVLLAGHDQDHLVEAVDDEAWEIDRVRLAEGRTGLADVLGRRGLGVRADLLHPWAHWITPAFEQRRYDTRFFVAGLPTGQLARDLGGEADRAHWLAPAEALRMDQRGEAILMPPTRVCLEELAAGADLAAVLATPRALRPVLPRLERRPDGRVVLRADLP